MKEKEFKGLLNKDDYDKLQELEWDKQFVQINFYYSNIQLGYHDEITMRVRCKQNHMCIQIKIRNKQMNGIRISDEYERSIEKVPGSITEDELRQIWSEYSYGDVILQGFLVTERQIKNIGATEIALDRNVYNGKIDYEIEFEYTKDEQEVFSIVEQLGLSDKLMLSKGKHDRFCSSL